MNTFDQIAQRMEEALVPKPERCIAVVTEEVHECSEYIAVRVVVDGILIYVTAGHMRMSLTLPSWYEIIGRVPDSIIHWRCVVPKE